MRVFPGGNVHCETARMGQPLRVRQISLASPQRLFGAFTLSYIDNSADKLDQMTGLIANRMTDRMNIPDRTARMNNAIVRFEVRVLGNRFSEQFSDSVLVLRVKSPKEFFESRRPGVRIEAKHAVGFLRPVPDLARSGPPRPTPGMTESLRFRQIRFALAPGRFRQLTLDGNAREIGNMFNRVLLHRARATRLAIVHGKRADHFAFGGKNRCGPTGAERVRQSQFAEISPQWIGRDVRHNDLFGSVSSRSTRTDGGSNESSVDRFGVSFRKMGCRAMSQLFSIRIH